MPLNKVKGNMYSFCTHTYNPIKGRCIHKCSYCYMKPFWKSEAHLDEKELKTDLGEGNFIFVGSSTDMFADDVPRAWIERTIEHCNQYRENTYLFQTKQPYNFFRVQGMFLKNMILGTTIETNRDTPSKAPHPKNRMQAMKDIYNRKFVTIEPVIEFDLDIMVRWIKDIKPEFVNIGADSKGNNLQEPSSFKIHNLITELEKFTKVNLKENLNRLLENPAQTGESK